MDPQHQTCWEHTGWEAPSAGKFTYLALKWLSCTSLYAISHCGFSLLCLSLHNRSHTRKASWQHPSASMFVFLSFSFFFTSHSWLALPLSIQSCYARLITSGPDVPHRHGSYLSFHFTLDKREDNCKRFLPIVARQWYWSHAGCCLSEEHDKKRSYCIGQRGTFRLTS